MKNLTEKETKELIDACEGYKDEQKKVSYHKKEQDKYGKIIKNILGDDFDDEFLITEEENGEKKIIHKIIFKKVISIVISKEEMQKDGILEKYQDLTESHPLKLY